MIVVISAKTIRHVYERVCLCVCVFVYVCVYVFECDCVLSDVVVKSTIEEMRCRDI